MIWWALGIIFVAGAVGGVVNALMTDNGFMMPKPDTQGGTRIIRPGFLGNMLVGGIAAAISWGLYGPASAVPLLPPTAAEQKPGGGEASTPTYLTLAGFVGGMLVGVAGARWLSNEVDKNLLRAAASQAALANKNDALAATLAVVPPAQALAAAKGEAGKP